MEVNGRTMRKPLIHSFYWCVNCSAVSYNLFLPYNFEFPWTQCITFFSKLDVSSITHLGCSMDLPAHACSLKQYQPNVQCMLTGLLFQVTLRLFIPMIIKYQVSSDNLVLLSGTVVYTCNYLDNFLPTKS